MRLVILESPYSGDTKRNLAYLDLCILDCLQRGESPYASHKMLTSALDDQISLQRCLGITAGLAWYRVAEACVVYADYGITKGMQLGINAAISHKIQIEYRYLGATTARVLSSG